MNGGAGAPEAAGSRTVFSHAVQGTAHQKIGRACQDAAGSRTEEQFWAIAVADGHGSPDYPRSGQGAAFAVAAALEEMLRFLRTGMASRAALKHLERQILRHWRELVDSDLAQRPFAPAELAQVSARYRSRYATAGGGFHAYGSTLLAACGQEGLCCGIQIGDGSWVAVDAGGSARFPIPEDPRCQMNLTTSLCDGNALEEFRHCFLSPAPAAVFLGTDGIDNSYSGPAELLWLYRAMALVWGEQGPETGAAEIRAFLPKISRQGSGDDVSLACAVRRPLELETLEQLRRELGTR